MTTLTGGRAGRWAAVRASPWSVVLGIGPLVFVLETLAVLGSPSPAGLAMWWPAAAPAAVAVALVVRHARAGPDGDRPDLRRSAPVVGVLLAIAVGSACARLLIAPSVRLALSWAVLDVAHAVVAGLFLAAGPGLSLRTLPDLARLAGGALAGALVAGVVAVSVGQPALGGQPLLLFWEVSASRASALLLLVPFVMRLPQHRSPAGRVESAALSLLVVVSTVVVFGPYGALSITFLQIAVLVAAALRQSPRLAIVQMLAVAALVTLFASRALGPFAVPDGQVASFLVPSYLVAGSATVLSVVLTVAARDAALDALADQRQFDRAVLESVTAGVLAGDAGGRIVVGNAAYRRIAGAPDVVAPAGSPLGRALGGEETGGLPLRLGEHDVVVGARPIHAVDGRLLGAVATYTDVTGERAVQARLRRAVTFQDAVLAATPDIIFITDVGTHKVVWVSGPAEAVLGLSPRQIVELDRQSRLHLVSREDVGSLHAADDEAATLFDGQVQTVRVRMIDHRGEPMWMSRRVTPFTRDRNGRVVQLLGVCRDVTDVVEFEQRLTDEANRDPLTGLLNRRALLYRLDDLVARSRSRAEATPVLFCDLDGFKAVNDTFGHAAGDLLLVTVAQRIGATLRDGDTFARAGGDEFVLLLETDSARPDDSRPDALERARSVARRILDSVARPVDVAGTQRVVTLSIGIALVRPGTGARDVLRDADAAMYRAKSTGKNRVHVFEVVPDRARSHPN